MNKSIINEYTAYVKNENKEGFVHFEYGQGEQLLFLVDDIECADFWETKEGLLNELSYEGIKPEQIEFYLRKTEVVTTISKVF